MKQFTLMYPYVYIYIYYIVYYYGRSLFGQINPNCNLQVKGKIIPLGLELV